MTPELEPRGAHFVLGRIDEILTWEKIREKERDMRFVELGDFLKQRGQQPLLHSVRIQSLKPSELLLSDRMRKLLDCVTPAFDWVVLDSPPALPVHDASSLADLATGSCSSCEPAKPTMRRPRRLRSSFEKKTSWGVVLNQENSEAQGGYYYVRTGSRFSRVAQIVK